MLRVGIDGKLLGGQMTGMATGLFNILINLDIKDMQFTLYVDDSLAKDVSEALLSKGILLKKIHSFAYPIWEQIVLPYYGIKDEIDIFWFHFNTSSIFIKSKVFLTVHDMIFMENKVSDTPTWYKKFGLLYRKLVVPVSVRKSDCITTVSHYSKSQITKYFPEYSNKIFPVHHGCVPRNDYLAKEDWSEFCRQHKITRKYILSFGSTDRRKNTLRVIKVYEAMRSDLRRNYQLVLYGFRNWKTSDEYKYVVENNLKDIIILDYVNNRELGSLYQNASCFVFASLSEGFGLPPLEAMQNHVAVIASNTSCIPEILGEAALLVSPEDTYNIKEAIEKVLMDPVFARSLIERGDKCIKQYDWKATANEYCKMIKDLDR